MISPVERRDESRFIGALAGQYIVGTGVGEQPVAYPCRTQSVSSTAIAIRGAVRAREGTSVAAHIDVVGTVRGTVLRRTNEGIVIRLVQSLDEKEKLQAKVDWLRKRASGRASDKRTHRRFKPRLGECVVDLGNGPTSAKIIDFSGRGAAVMSDDRPKVGTPARLGQLRGTVARHLSNGFAIRFDEEQDVTTLEERARDTGTAV